MTVIAMLGPELDTRLLLDGQELLVQDIAEDNDSGNCKLAYEQCIRAGSFNGFIELQVVRCTQSDGMHYVGKLLRMVMHMAHISVRLSLNSQFLLTLVVYCCSTIALSII